MFVKWRTPELAWTYRPNSEKLHLVKLYPQFALLLTASSTTKYNYVLQQITLLVQVPVRNVILQ
jgi:hypothetical protein